MDRSDVITLVAQSYAADAIGQQIATETTRDVFCQLSSVTQSEWFEAGRAGLKAEYRATMFAPDYDGEEIAIVNNRRYGIYRTFLGKNETIELYLERKAGV